MPPVKVCPACRETLEPHTRDVCDVNTAETFSIWRCPECGLGVTAPVPADLEPYYSERYYGNRHSFTASLCAWRRREMVARTLPVARSRRLLDVGCGDGRFLKEAARAGWDVAGVEINPGAQGDGFPLFRDLEEAAIYAPYRCITLWHVLEHIPDPAECIRKLRGMLEPDGVLLMAVPDFGGFQARVFGRHWLHLDVPRHLYHFTSSALAKLLDAADLEAIRTWHQEFEYDCFGWIQSALNAVNRIPNVLFDSLTGKPRRAARWQVAASYAALPALGVPALALTAAATLARRGSTIIVAARPKSR